MNQVYNPESVMIEEIERLAAEARDIRRKIEHAVRPDDRRALRRQLQDLDDEVRALQERLAS